MKQKFKKFKTEETFQIKTKRKQKGRGLKEDRRNKRSVKETLKFLVN